MIAQMQKRWPEAGGDFVFDLNLDRKLPGENEKKKKTMAKRQRKNRTRNVVATRPNSDHTTTAPPLGDDFLSGREMALSKGGGGGKPTPPEPDATVPTDAAPATSKKNVVFRSVMVLPSVGSSSKRALQRMR